MGGDGPQRQRTGPAPARSDLTEAQEERYKRARLRLIGLALQFGGTTIGSLAICLGGGLWLDRRLGTSPLFLLIGLVIAFLAVGYNLYQIATVRLEPRRSRATAEGNGRPRRQTSNWDDDEQDEDDDWPVRRRADR